MVLCQRSIIAASDLFTGLYRAQSLEKCRSLRKSIGTPSRHRVLLLYLPTALQELKSEASFYIALPLRTAA
jgi:hypothetical protein